MSELKGSTSRHGHDVSNQPRVPKGNGDKSGQWMAAAERLRQIGKFEQFSQEVRDKGHFIYGTPRYGIAQYARSETIRELQKVSEMWRNRGEIPFGVGNMSLLDGRPYDGHTDHGEGLAVDIRPVRKDTRQMPTSYKDAAYDREATQRLVNELLKTGRVEQVLFNDPTIGGVTPWDKNKGPRDYKPHDWHLHVKMRRP